MNTRSRLFFLIGIMAVVSLSATGVSIYWLYRLEEPRAQERMANIVRSQAKLIEEMSGRHGEATLLSMAEMVQEASSGIYETGEVLIVTRKDEQIEFLAVHRNGEHMTVEPIPWAGSLAEPSRRALAGEAGTTLGLDNRGVMVIAAFEPVKAGQASWGLVAKVDLEEVQAPFRRAAMFGALLDLGLVLLAAVMFVRFSDPLYQRLEESQQRFSALFHQSFNLLWTLKPDGTIVEANRTALDVAGVIASAAVGRPFWETRWWPDAGTLRDQLQAAVREAAEGNLMRLEVEARGFGNRRVTLDLSFKPVTDRSGRVALLSVEARDITERKQAEEALQRAEEKYHSIFENAVEGIYQTTPAGQFLAANPAMARILGYESPETLLRDRQEIGRTGYADPQRREEFKRELAERGFVSGFEYEACRKDGARVWLSENARAVRDDGGSVLYYEGIAEDITERKRAERELAERTAYLDALIANSPLGIVVLDAHNRVMLCNPAFEALFGYKAEGATGRDLDALVAPRELEAEASAITERASREVVHLTGRRRRRDGTLVEVEIHGVPLVVEGELRGVYAIYEDITERRRAEEEREKLLRELQEALANIKTLSGLLPICASCKKIRDDGGYWSQIESYISAHSNAAFSHGICPDCAKQLYPEHYHKMFPELEEKQPKDS